LGVTVALLTLLLGSGFVTKWIDRGTSQSQVWEQRRNEHLSPVATALTENKELFVELSGSNFNEPGWGIQESYYEKVRRDGPAKHLIMRDKIQALVDNNKTVLAHLNAYEPYMSPMMKVQADLFRRHAVRYNSRWPAMTSAAETGADIPVAEPVFPEGFPSAVQEEIKRVNAMIER
jgi:hypothetical protein